ncbi:MAG: hypothetical protein HC771_24645 [Synechococcales cyanobacterium CRU_2_2]|nr:hypothetical protein [Synechococcales cyanobacterium CRU_2_2]
MIKQLEKWIGSQKMHQAREEILIAMLVEQMLLRSGQTDTMQADAERWVRKSVEVITSEWPGWTYMGIAAEMLEPKIKQSILKGVQELKEREARQRAGG